MQIVCWNKGKNTYAGAKAASQAPLLTENDFIIGPVYESATRFWSTPKVKGAVFVIVCTKYKIS